MEELSIAVLGYLTNDTVVANHANGPDMITKQAEAAAKLAIATCLSMATHTDISALSMWNKEPIMSEIGVEVLELIADTNKDQCPVLGNGDLGVEDLHVLVRIGEVDLNVLATGRAGSAVLVTTTLDGDCNLVLSGPVDSPDDILVSLWLNDHGRVQVAFLLVG